MYVRFRHLLVYYTRPSDRDVSDRGRLQAVEQLKNLEIVFEIRTKVSNVGEALTNLIAKLLLKYELVWYQNHP